MANIEIVFCNRAYGEEWFENIKQSNPEQFKVFATIVEVIQDNDGGDITQAEVFAKDQTVEQYLRTKDYKIIPSNGTLLQHNGEGIRHAKYSPSKNIAILWENIDGTIYVTFDDHAPVRYHRAIYFLRQLRLGNQPFIQNPRDSRRFRERLWDRSKRKNKGINPYKRFYK